MEFRSCEQALRFAWNMSERVEYAKMDLLRVRGTSEDALSPSDLHAQAAFIMAQVDRLPGLEALSVKAMFARGNVRTQAIRELARHLFASLSGTLPDEGALMIVIMHWATRRPPIRAIAEAKGVSYRKVCAWRTAVLRQWLPIQVRAVDRLHHELLKSGLEFG
jgi:hypothetical protein